MKRVKRLAKGKQIITMLIGICLLVLLYIMAFCDFSIFPEEMLKQDLVKEDIKVETTETSEEEYYKYDTVQQGDLKISDDISCRAKCKDEISLQFSKSGLEYGNIYVNVGDTVKKGDLLAELNMTEVDSNLADTEKEYKLRQLEVEHYNTQIKDKKQMAALNTEEKKAILEEAAQLEEEKNSCIAQMNLAKTRYEEALEDKQTRQLVAPKDGVITYIYDLKGAEKTNTGETTLLSSKNLEFMRMSEGNYYFTCSTTQYENYPVGTKVDMKIENQTYEMKVIKAEPIEDDKEGKYQLDFDFTGSVYNLTSNSTGQLMTKEKKLHDVLYVNVNAIVTIQDKTYAYVVNKKGVRTLKEVTTGLNNGENIEIKKGLSVGEQVILK